MFLVAIESASKNKTLFYAEVSMLPKIQKIITSLNDNDDDIFFYIESCKEKEYKDKVKVKVKDVSQALDIIENAYIFA
jgi:cellulose synthase/poly-beta-1,6-N-acetylglucosamine synthase-like glycosyltransferase